MHTGFRKMLRQRIHAFLPDRQTIHAHRWLAPLENSLLHPRLWHLNRRSAAGAVAAGLFCGLIPGPLQMLGAAICAIVFRINLPLAMLTTLYTNPFTIVPLYALAFALGKWALSDHSPQLAEPPELGDGGLFSWLAALFDWMVGLGLPLAFGLILLATGLSTVGYVLVRLAWRIALIRAWRQRKRR